MVEPLFFSAIGDDTDEGSLLVLAGSEAKHALKARRMTLGESIAVSDGAGLKIRGKISKISKDTIEVSVESHEKLVPPACQLVLVQALAKGDRDELAIQACTELGVYGVIPWQADRSISIWKQEKLLKGRSRWQSIVTEAAKQSLRPFVPVVGELLNTQELVQVLKGFDKIIVLDPESKTSITDIVFPSLGKIAVVVGPEGGIAGPELAAFVASGFELVHLGSGVLRTSTAGMAAISYLQAKLGDWV